MSLVYDGRLVLRDVTWALRPGERWIVLGRNGSGKTSLVRIASLYLHPSRGRVTFLGEVLGRMDVRRMRQRIGLASSSLAAQLRPQLSAQDIVMTAKNAALEPWWHTYDDADRARAAACLERFGLSDYGERTFATLSSGEQQRVLLARSFMNDPALVLLDEPTAGLDLRGREELVGALSALARSDDATPVILVTHHVDEIPPGFTHALLLADGAPLACGPLDVALTSETLSACFELSLDLERRGERFSAFAR